MFTNEMNAGERRLGTGIKDDAIVMLHFVFVCRCTKSTGDNEDIKKIK